MKAQKKSGLGWEKMPVNFENFISTNNGVGCVGCCNREEERRVYSIVCFFRTVGTYFHNIQHPTKYASLTNRVAEKEVRIYPIILFSQFSSSSECRKKSDTG